jgi:hypothetical protein
MEGTQGGNGLDRRAGAQETNHRHCWLLRAGL